MECTEIKCEFIGYLSSKYKEKVFYDKDEVLAGNDVDEAVMYKTVCQFDLKDVDLEDVVKAELCLLVKFVKIQPGNNVRLVLKKLNKEYDLKNVNYETIFSTDIYDYVELNVPIKCGNIAFDITSVIDACDLCNDYDINDKNQFIIEAISPYSKGVAAFGSALCKSAPKIIITYGKDICEQEEYSYEEYYKKYYSINNCDAYLDYNPYEGLQIENNPEVVLKIAYGYLVSRNQQLKFRGEINKKIYLEYNDYVILSNNITVENDLINKIVIKEKGVYKITYCMHILECMADLAVSIEVNNNAINNKTMSQIIENGYQEIIGQYILKIEKENSILAIQIANKNSENIKIINLIYADLLIFKISE